MNIDWIRTKVISGDYEFSAHADDERQADKISVHEVEYALLKGEIIENYPDDTRGHSSLLLGFGEEGYPIHIVCGKTKSGILRIITIYIPTLPKWINPKTRKE